MAELETKALNLVAKKCPHELAELLTENFLPPSQIMVCLDVLENHMEQEEFQYVILPLLDHWSSAIKMKVRSILGIMETS